MLDQTLIMTVIFSLGLLSIVIILLARHFPDFRHLLPPSSRLQPSERLITNYLLREQINNLTFQDEHGLITLVQLINKSESVFSRLEVTHAAIKEQLEQSIEDYFTVSPAVQTGPLLQSPAHYGRYIYFSLVGYSVAEAMTELIGKERYVKKLSPAVIRKFHSPSAGPFGRQDDTINLLKAMTVLPWPMLKHTLDYWIIKSKQIIAFHDDEKNHLPAPSLAFDLMIAGYKKHLHHFIISRCCYHLEAARQPW